MKFKNEMFPERKPRENYTFEKVIFIDPGLTGSGWAFFTVIKTKNQKSKIITPFDTGSIIPSNHLEWQGKANFLWSWFGGYCSAMNPKNVVIEFPENWGGSEKSAASSASGALFKLVYLIGGFSQIAQAQGMNKPVLITPKNWKGQLPKEVIIQRIQKHFPDMKPKDHEADAIGMGIAAQGLL